MFVLHELAGACIGAFKRETTVKRDEILPYGFMITLS